MLLEEHFHNCGDAMEVKLYLRWLFFCTSASELLCLLVDMCTQNACCFYGVDLRRGGSTGALQIPPPPPDFVSEKLNTLFSPLALF